jgi:HSP20 family protein
MFALMRPLRSLERSLFRPERDPFRLMRNELESLFSRFPVAETWLPAPAWEVEEAEREVVLRLELPGFEPNEIELSLEGMVLLARAAHAAAAETGAAESARRREAAYRFELPAGLDLEHVEARYRSGVLEVHVPRLPGTLPRRIEVKT